MTSGASEEPVAAPSSPGSPAGAGRSLALFLVAAVFAAAFAYGLHRIELDVDFVDEGFALTSPLRLALGDVPFRDELGNPTRMFDLVLSPVFRVFPYVTVYQLRLGWLVVQLASAFALFWAFRRFASPLPLALACGATVWLPNVIWSPSYHMMGTFFLVLSWALWLLGCRSERWAAWFGIASGCAFGLSALSYVLLVVVAVVPAVVLASALWQGRRDATRRATLWQLATFGVLALVAVGSILYAGLADDWLHAATALRASGNYSVPLLGRLWGFWLQVDRFPPVVLAAAAVVVGMGVSLRGWDALLRVAGGRVWLVGAVLAALGAAAAQLVYLHPTTPLRGLVATETHDYHHWLRCVSLVVGWHLGALVLFAIARPRDRERSWWMAYFSVAVGAAMLAGVQGIAGGHAFKTVVAILPLAVTGAAAVQRAVAGPAADAPRRVLSAVFAGLLCITLGAGIYRTKATYNYQGESPAELTTEFSYPLLRGIRSDPKKVEAVEQTVDFLSTRIRPGEFFLAFPGIPLFYYLTHTRPAINHSLTTREVPLWVRTEAVKRMIQEGRVPRYAIRGLGNMHVIPKNRNQDPLGRFLFARFHRLVTFRYYEVWERNDLE